MLPNIANSRAAKHLGAILLAITFATCIIAFLSKSNLQPSLETTHFPNIGTGRVATERLITLESALRDGRTVVLLGSSELGSRDLEFIPYKYLPNKLGIPVIAHGHAYFQSFGIYGLLAANENALSPATKLVIMVSPGWFKESDIPTSAFLEHFQPQLLTRLYQSPEHRGQIASYIKSHIAQFEKPTSHHLAFLSAVSRPGSTSDSEQPMHYAAIKQSLFTLKVKSRMLLSGQLRRFQQPGDDTSATRLSDTQWQELDGYARSLELAQMKNNKRWVRDDYHEKYLRDLPESGKDYYPSNLDIKSEYAALARTLYLLKARGVHALVVMQPINPFVYKDSEKTKLISDKVSRLTTSTGMSYLDLSNTDNYEPGMLRDSMHLGELGWVRVNQRIVNYYDHGI